MTADRRLGAIHTPPPPAIRPLAARAGLHMMKTPQEADWFAKCPADGDDLGNNRYSNCVAACDLRIIQARRANAWGDAWKPDTQMALSLYALRTGFDPVVGKPDDGTDTAMDMSDWAAVGIRLDSQNLDVIHWATVDPQNDEHIAIAIGCLGPVAVTLALPLAWKDLDLWAAAPGSGPDWEPAGWGLHRVPIGKFTGRERVARSWGNDLLIHPDSWTRFVGAVDAGLSREWLEATGLSPAGLDWAALEQDTAGLG